MDKTFLDKNDIEEYTDKELLEQTTLYLIELRNRDLDIPQVDKY